MGYAIGLSILRWFIFIPQTYLLLVKIQGGSNRRVYSLKLRQPFCIYSLEAHFKIFIQQEFQKVKNAGASFKSCEGV
ncbi:hypothetical protein NIES2130_22700 [Scytonema sp. HK-05]|nr:hypothetical protein NIES2130_22700 [Scytonema sp. HK-05]